MLVDIVCDYKSAHLRSARWWGLEKVGRALERAIAGW